jgi:hypothetical protein
MTREFKHKTQTIKAWGLKLQLSCEKFNHSWSAQDTELEINQLMSFSTDYHAFSLKKPAA